VGDVGVSVTVTSVTVSCTCASVSVMKSRLSQSIRIQLDTLVMEIMMLTRL